MLAVLAIVAVFVAARHRYSGKPAEVLPASECDASLWDHVYEKDRLKVVAPCAAVRGRVAGVRRSEDGDLHIALQPDDASALNLINVFHAHRTLVVEAVCEHVPKDDPARSACQSFHPAILVPAVGDRVRVVGAYVTDVDNSWNEIHPVSRIESLP